MCDAAAAAAAAHGWLSDSTAAASKPMRVYLSVMNAVSTTGRASACLHTALVNNIGTTGGRRQFTLQCKTKTDKLASR